MEGIKLSVCRTDITPQVGGRLYGYQDDFYSTGINDRLFATALCFEYQGTRAILISADVCLINTALAKRLREEISEECSVPYDSIVIAAVHTHSGPNTAGEEGWGKIDEEYCENVFVPSLKKICRNAVASRGIPVKAGFAVTKSKIGINRRELHNDGSIGLGQNEWGCYDPDLTVIAFVDENDKPVANIIHYGAHNTAAGMCPLISRDWCGVMCDRLEAISGCPSVYFNGCEGDVGPRLTNGATVGGMDYALEHGAFAAWQAIDTYRLIKEYHETDLAIKKVEIDIPLEKRLPLDFVREEYEKVKSAVYNIDRQSAFYYENIISAYENAVPEEESRRVDISVIRIGNFNFIAFPYEMFSEISLRLKKACESKRILCLSNANGNCSYFPSQDQICRGGYEIKMFKTVGTQSMVDDADNYLVGALIRGLEDF